MNIKVPLQSGGEESAADRIMKQLDNRMTKDILVKIPIPPKLELGGKEFPNPAYNVPTYEYKTVSSYKLWHEHVLEWYEKHKNASALVVNQDGQPLYALYAAPAADHAKMVDGVFKMLRAQRYSEDEYE